MLASFRAQTLRGGAVTAPPSLVPLSPESDLSSPSQDSHGFRNSPVSPTAPIDNMAHVIDMNPDSLGPASENPGVAVNSGQLTLIASQSGYPPVVPANPALLNPVNPPLLNLVNPINPPLLNPGYPPVASGHPPVHSVGFQHPVANSNPATTPGPLGSGYGTPGSMTGGLLYHIQAEKPEKFRGERGEDVDEFLITMSMYLQGLNLPPGPQLDQYKVIILHRHLIGRARQFWMELAPGHKETYDLAAAALRRRFPKPSHTTVSWNSRTKAITEMNILSQGNMTTEEYMEKANELYTVLGEDHAISLATRFVDGINDRTVQIQVDTQMRGEYTPFAAVIQAYSYSTTTIRRQEVARKKQETHAEPKQQDLQQVIYQFGELMKGLVSEQSKAQVAQEMQSYRPIIGAVDQQPLSNPQYQSQPQSLYQHTPQQPVYPSASERIYPQPPHRLDTRYDQSRRYQPQQQGTAQGGRYRVTCFTCGEPGHRAYECQQPRGIGSTPNATQVNTTHGGVPMPPVVRGNQPTSAAVVHVVEDDTEPAGTMTMAANLVDIVKQERERDVIHRLRNGTYTHDDVALLEAAMSEKRTRERDDLLAKAAPPVRRLRTEAPVIESASNLQDTIRVNPIG